MNKDTHTVLTELKERMERERDEFLATPPADEVEKIDERAYVAAITRCIALVEEKLKANSKEI